MHNPIDEDRISYLSFPKKKKKSIVDNINGIQFRRLGLGGNQGLF